MVQAGPQIVDVTRGTIRSVVVLDGAVGTAAPLVVRSPITGSVQKVARAGATVARGSWLAIIKGKSTRVVLAPDDGVVLDIGAPAGAHVVAGDVVLRFAPRRFEAVATIEPALLYRFYGPPVSITVQIDHGPSPFECPLVSVGAEVEPGVNPYDAPVVLRCGIPADTRAFSGVRARIAVVTAQAENVLRLPVEAVNGSAQRGMATLVDSAGTHRPVEIELGISDGIFVEIVSGLAEGDRVIDPPEGSFDTFLPTHQPTSSP